MSERAGPPIGLLVMAYGTATGPDDVERYYTDIRGGRAPSREHLDDLKDRYAAIGNRFPLLEITRSQAEALERTLNATAGGDRRYRSYVGMKHAPPFIAEAVAAMQRDGIERAVGIVMAPHWSGMSIETYVDRVEKAVADEGGPAVSVVRRWYDHPGFVALLADRVAAALGRLPEDARAHPAVIFSAHSLPVRTDPDGETRCLRCTWCEASCRYAAQLRHAADLVGARLALPGVVAAWQSAGRTGDPWWGPSIEAVIPELAAAGCTGVVVCPGGFVADHLEVLYDLDIEARAIADQAGVPLVRTEMPNADARFIGVLADIVGRHLDAEGD
jgi:ferrochelatase